VKAPQSASVHCKFSVLSFCTSSLILHNFQSDLYQQNTTPTLTMVALVFLLTYLATCLMSYTAAAPTDAPSVLLPLNDPSFPQPTLE
jgi:cell shape-determining protein MreD